MTWVIKHWKAFEKRKYKKGKTRKIVNEMRNKVCHHFGQSDIPRWRIVRVAPHFPLLFSICLQQNEIFNENILLTKKMQNWKASIKISYMHFHIYPTPITLLMQPNNWIPSKWLRVIHYYGRELLFELKPHNDRCEICSPFCFVKLFPFSCKATLMHLTFAIL